MQVSHSTFFSKATQTEIHRVSIAPEEGGVPSRGTILALHGLGDHILCHEKAFRIFCDLGYRIEGFDWPGNGLSGGRRGDIPGVKPGIKLIGEVVDQMEKPPVAVYAHSTGGFIALPFVSRNQEKLGLDWFWLSSPLLRPSHEQSKLKILVADFVADFFPKLTVSTGVKPSACFHISNFEALKAEEFKSCHSKISVRFGRDLMMWEKRIEEAARHLEDPLRLLVTQGMDDHVCPPEYSEELFKAIPLTDKTLIQLEGIRHEPLREPDNGEFIEKISHWLTELSRVKTNTLN